jgi:uncharacterized protein (TIGR02118 family)
MQRVVIYLKRRTNLSQPLFFDWCLGQHRVLAEQLPGLRQYIISLAADAQDGAFDGMAELWFDDLAAADAGFASPAGLAARADAEAHVVRRERLNLTEHTIIDHPTPPRCKFAAGLKRRADMSRAEFAHWWLERHVPYVTKFPEVRKYRVSLVESGPETSVDGLTEVWFDDMATLRRVTASEVVKEAQRHSVAHTRDRIRLFVEEHRIRSLTPQRS